MERLHKVLARSGAASRRAAERFILAGRVRVNGEIVRRLGSQVDPERDAIEVDGRRLDPRPRTHTYLLLNKPRGVLTTLSDPQRRPTILDLLAGVQSRVFPVGRLDFNSEGLLLLTDDGDLARSLLHPSCGIEKTYSVKVRGRPSDEALGRLERGIVLDGRRTLPARVERIEDARNAWLGVTVVEGRKHLIRKMFDSIGHPVVKLRRTALDGLRLGELPAGRWRPLRPAEVARLRAAVRPAGGP